MAITPAGPGSLVAFGVVLALVIGAAVAAVWWATRERRQTLAFALGLAAWLGALSAWVGSGVLDRPVPWLLLFFVASNGMGLAVGLSPLGRRIAAAVPLPALVGFQGFRLPLELVLHAWVETGTIPRTMTWDGSNPDIVSGAVALAAAPLAGRFRAAAWAANAIGGALLLNVMRVAMLSSPVPFGWGTEPPLVLAAHLPYALIVPVCVAGALAGHVVLTRRLLGPAPSR